MPYLEMTSSEQFSAAVQFLVRRLGHGQQQQIARRLGVKPQYFSDLLHGRKPWSDKYRDRIARILGFSVADIYAIGEEYARTGVAFPFVRQAAQYPPRTTDRAAFLARCAARELRLNMDHILQPPVLSQENAPELQAYLSGDLSDGEYFSFAKKALSEIISFYLQK